MGLHAASHESAYVGTFVVTTAHTMSSARIWHVCEGDRQIERVDTLTGAQRVTYRRNQQVVTLLPKSRLAVSEKRDSLGMFPGLLNRADSTIARFYQLRQDGHDRVAGYSTEVVELKPRDGLRFGYRIWTVQNSGLVVKLQTVDPAGSVLEQAAFSELQFTKPLSWGKLSAMMDSLDGYEIKRSDPANSSAEQEGWQIRVPVPGFRSMSFFKHSSARTGDGNGPLQWVFSDGIASLSLFLETFDASHHQSASQRETFSAGATHMINRRVGAWWLTAVGEVPVETLEMFALGLERRK
jgi:sigma-E factor negative regulatory protein RseB